MATPEYCFLFVDWWPLCMSKSEWASWFQAFASVFAIGAAGYGIYWQVKRQHQIAMKRDFEKAFGEVLSMLEFLRFAERHLQEWHRASIDAGVLYDALVSEFECRPWYTISKVLESLGPQSIEAPRLKLALLDAQLAFRRAKYSFDKRAQLVHNADDLSALGRGEFHTDMTTFLVELEAAIAPFVEEATRLEGLSR